MFRTTKCSSSGRLVHAVLWYVFMRPYKQSGRWQYHTSYRRPDCLCGRMKTYHKTACISLPEDEHLVVRNTRISKTV